MAEKNEVAVSFSEQLTDKLISVENVCRKTLIVKDLCRTHCLFLMRNQNYRKQTKDS
jgi:hypothetical protein